MQSSASTSNTSHRATDETANTPSMMDRMRSVMSPPSKGFASLSINTTSSSMGSYPHSTPQPIDLTNATTPTAAPLNLMVDEEDDEDYVPPGLADFVAQANRNLEATQQEFFSSTPSVMDGTSQPDGNPTFDTDGYYGTTTTDVTESFSMPPLPTLPTISMSAQTAASAPSFDEYSPYYQSRPPPSSSDNSYSMPINSIERGSSDDEAYQSDILQCFSTAMVAGQISPAGAMEHVQPTEATPEGTIMSPDLFLSPPPNPVFGMSDTDIERQAMGVSSVRSPPPHYESVVNNSAYTPAVALAAAAPPSTAHLASPPPTSIDGSMAARTSTTTPKTANVATPTLSTATNENSLLGIKLVVSNDDGQEMELDAAMLPTGGPDGHLQLLTTGSSTNVLPDQKNLMQLLSSIDHTTSKDVSQSSPASDGAVPQVQQHDLIDFAEVSVPFPAAAAATTSDIPFTPTKGSDVAAALSPSPLSMSSPSKTSVQARQQEQVFSEQLRTNPRVRASSPVYGLSPAPEEQLTLAQRLAADAHKSGLPPPTPDTDVTGPEPLLPSVAKPSGEKKASPSALVERQTGTKVEPSANAVKKTVEQRHTPTSSTVASNRFVGATSKPKPQLTVSTTQSPPLTQQTSNAKKISSTKSASSGNSIKRSSPFSSVVTSKSSSKSPAAATPAATSGQVLSAGVVANRQSPSTNSSKGSITKKAAVAPIPKPLGDTVVRITPRKPSPIAELLSKPMTVKPVPPAVTDHGVTPKGTKASPPQISSQRPLGASKPTASASSTLKVATSLSTPSPLSMASRGIDSSKSATHPKSLSVTTQAVNLSETDLLPKPDTPSPLSMSSPKFALSAQRDHVALASMASSSTAPSQPPPRFSPPSPRMRTAARFTAETANRLAKPVTKTPPPPSSDATTPLTSVTGRGEAARFTADSAKRLSTTKSKNPTPASRTDQTPPPPSKGKDAARFTADSAKRLSTTKAKSPVPTSLSNAKTPSSTMNGSTRLATESGKRISAAKTTLTSAPSSSRSAPRSHHSASTSVKPPSESVALASPEPPSAESTSRQEALARTIASALNGHATASALANAQSPPSTAHPSKATLSSPARARDANSSNEASLQAHPRPIKPEKPPRLASAFTPSSPLIFTAEAADRLMRPTCARSLAIAASPKRRTVDGEAAEGDFHRGDEEQEEYIFRAEHTIPIPATSHLLQGTAVSDARKTTPTKRVERPPPPRRFVSGVSDRLMSRTAANQANVDDGPAKARERLRQRQLERMSRTLSSPERKAKGKTKFSAEDGIAKAKERLRKVQRQQQQLLRKQAVMDIKVSSAEKLDARGSHHDAASSHPSTKRVLTVPQGPKFATSARRGERPPTGRTDAQPLAQSVVAFGKGLRDDMSSAGSHGSSQRSLTVPAGPKLATDVLLGEKSRPPPPSRADVSMAQSSDVLQNGLRAPYYPSAAPRASGPTIPHSPKFQTMSSRELPKSSMEKEAEEMEYFKSHPFKAKSTRRETQKRTLSTGKDGLPSFMRPTKVQAVRTQVLPTHIKIKVPTPRSKPRLERVLVDEVPQPFRARPLPSSTHQAPPPISPSARLATKPVETFQPTMTEASRRRAEELALERDRRKSLQAESRVAPANLRRSSSEPARRLTQPQPFRFATTARMGNSA